jgi:hypothetical protein
MRQRLEQLTPIPKIKPRRHGGGPYDPSSLMAEFNDHLERNGLFAAIDHCGVIVFRVNVHFADHLFL